MPRKSLGSANVWDRPPLYRNIFTGAIIGGFAGAIAGIFDEGSAITGTALGIIIGGGLGAIVGHIPVHEANENNSMFNKTSGNVLNDTDQKVHMRIREEQLDIAKKLIQTGEVSVHKELVKEDKNFVVPVTREELVIEKKVLDTKAPGKADKHIETIRIPISEERIEVIKRPVILNNVSINKRQIQKTKRVEGTVKKEKVHLEVTGVPKIRKKDL